MATSNDLPESDDIFDHEQPEIIPSYLDDLEALQESENGNENNHPKVPHRRLFSPKKDDPSLLDFEAVAYSSQSPRPQELELEYEAETDKLPHTSSSPDKKRKCTDNLLEPSILQVTDQKKRRLSDPEGLSLLELNPHSVGDTSSSGHIELPRLSLGSSFTFISEDSESQVAFPDFSQRQFQLSDKAPTLDFVDIDTINVSTNAFENPFQGSIDLLAYEGSSSSTIFKKPSQKETCSSDDLEEEYQEISFSALKICQDNLVATNFDGKQIRIPIKKNEPSIKAKISKKVRLLSKSIYIMLKEIEQKKFNTIIDEATDESFIADTTSSGPHLWVDKYAPKQFVDLIGNTNLNKEVLRWVKEWDYCVFGKKKKSKHGIEPDELKIQMRKDPYLRPEKRILLLSGPPGLGKTTLAHVVAKQLGYNVIEINASDDRTVSVFKPKVLSAVEMMPVIGCKKPNLIIVDEIDGVADCGGESIVNFLINLASTNPVSRATVKDEEKVGKKRKKKSVLRRPIICICNDPYVPALRALRAYAQIYRFQKMPSLSLSKRLGQICSLNGIKAEMRALTSLCDMSDGDMRSCLHTLQILRRKTTQITMELISSSETTIGSKDTKKALISLLESIFWIPRTNKSVSNPSFSSSFEGHSSRLWNDILMASDEDRLFLGCFENYLNMKLHYLSFDKIVEIGDWIYFHERSIHHVVFQHHQDLRGYLPCAPMCFHRFFASTLKPKVEFPFHTIQKTALLKQNRNMFESFHVGLPRFCARFYGSKSTLLLETIPFLLRIISPMLSLSAIREKDNNALQNIVNVMLCFNLQYIQQKNDAGEWIYCLEPPIENLIHYHIKLATSLGVISYPFEIKQKINQEIAAQSIRNQQNKNFGDGQESKNQLVKEPTGLEQKKTGPFNKKKISFNFLKAAFDKENNSNGDANTTPTITFKYNEGYSNAVRRKVLMSRFCQ